MEKIWSRKPDSFQEAEHFDNLYYRAMSKTERLETIQFLREEYRKIKSRIKHEGRERLRRVITVVQ